MRVAITGYSGFIGSHLASKLRQKYELIGIARNKAPNNIPFANITSEEALISTFAQCDVVIHCAAKVHSMQKPRDGSAEEYDDVNVVLTKRLAALAASVGVSRFVFISSIKVNGEVTYDGEKFSYDSLPEPSDLYGKSKYAAELELRRIEADTGMEVVIVRPALVYGGGVKANFRSLFNITIPWIPLPFGCVRINKRSFLGINNLVDLIDVCIIRRSASGETFLASDDCDVSTYDLVRLIGDVKGIKPLLIPIPVCVLRMIGCLSTKGARVSRLIDSLQIDMSHTKEILNWRPPYTMSEELRLMHQTNRDES